MSLRRATGVGGRSVFVVPQRGPKSDLLRLAADNAKHAFEEKRRSDEDVEARLARLQNKLRLPKLPRRIECVDISHLGGLDAVGAVVALLDGKPDKARYRTYRVHPQTPGDDYGAMFEVLSRRFLRGVKAQITENDPEEPSDEASSEAAQWELPDLFVVDGGRGAIGRGIDGRRGSRHYGAAHHRACQREGKPDGRKAGR